MASNEENTKFAQSPYEYICANIVNNTGAGGDGHLVYGVAKQNDGRLNMLGGSAVQLAGEIGTMSFDFMPARISGQRNVLFRPAIRAYADRIKGVAALKRQQARQGNAAGIMSDSEIDRVVENLPDDPDNLITGYYFPYRYGGVASLADMGQVSVPKSAPAHKFVFTGAMNGCHLVVTEDPDDDTRLRFYHYQSARSNPIYLKDGKSSGAKTIGQHAAFGRVYYWLTNEEYGGDPNDITEVNGFNFFYYNDTDKKWWAYSLPLKTGKPTEQGIAMLPSSAKPFGFKLNY